MSNKENRSIGDTLSNSAHVVLQTFGVFAVLTFLLILIDFVPVPVTNESTSTSTDVLYATPASGNTTEAVDVPYELTTPVRIVIDDIDVDTTVLSPTSTDVEVLDRALLSGAVLYPGSGLAGESANMLIFGHSSYLPVVRNEAYKAFNELGELHDGDVVTVYSDTHTYEYTVRDVYLANADDAVIYFEADTPTLTLATCNTFGAKQERWVVTASLTDKKQYVQ